MAMKKEHQGGRSEMDVPESPAEPSLVLVCVTDQKQCERLIHAGVLVARRESLAPHVFSVQPKAQAGRNCGIALEYLFRIAKDSGADMTVYYSDDPMEVTSSFLGRKPVRHIVTGLPSTGGRRQDSGFVRELRKRFPGIPISMVDLNGSIHAAEPVPGREARSADSRERRHLHEHAIYTK